LSLVTTEKDFVRLKDRRALADLAARSRTLPVVLEIEQEERLRQLVLSVVTAAQVA
jgi:tetraacyldisaccharide-1-P 4'-kinase